MPQLVLGPLTIFDPAVSLTDVLLCIEAFWCAVLIARLHTRGQARVAAPPSASAGRVVVTLFFAFLSVASLLGAVYHAFYPLKETTDAGWVTWIAVTAATGFVMAALWSMAAYFAYGLRGLRYALYAAPFLIAALLYAIIEIDFHYTTVIIFYAPALVAFSIVAAHRTVSGNTGWGIIVFGLIFSYMAAGMQLSPFSVGVLDHNALYHILQAISLGLLCAGFRRVLS